MGSSAEPLASRIMEIREQMKEHPGQRVDNAIRALERPVGYLLRRNYQELDRHLAAFEQLAGILLFAEGNEQGMDAYVGEVQRLTHNLVASVGTVIDHTRPILETEWPDMTHPIRVGFEDAKQVFQDDGRLVLFRQLRNFLLHVSMPPIIVVDHLIGGEQDATTTVLLKTEALLEWDQWRQPAREILRTSGDAIVLRPLAAHYVNTAVELQQTVVNSIKTHEADTYGPWQALVEEHNAHVEEFKRLAAAARSRPHR